MPENASFNGKDIRLPEIKGRTVQLIVVAIICIVLVYTGLFTIDPEEVGVILRLGKYSHTVTPGLHFRIPFNIDKVFKVPVERQLKVEFGFRTIRAGVNSQFSQKDFQDESIMLTGDLNAAEIEWITQYRINDPFKFLFRVRNTQMSFRDINEAVMREVVGDRTVNEVLTVGRQEIATTVTVKLQELCDQYETGIKVEQVVLQDVNPPEPVKPAFNEVNEAQQEREKLINQAHSEYNRVIPKARGEAARTIEVAKGYALERVNQAKGEAARFTDVFKEYSRAKQVTRQRMYLETMNDVMQNVGRKLITDDNAAGILPLFQLEKGVQK